MALQRSASETRGRGTSRRGRGVRQPVQARAERTQERLLNAFLELLELHEPERITVEAIAARAHCSIGAFYKRFRSKQDLLPLLLARMQARAASAWENLLDDGKWRNAGLRLRIDFLVDQLTELFVQRRRLLKVFVAGRFHGAVANDAGSRELASAQMRRIEQWLFQCRSEITHDDPERALRVGLYLCLQSLQTAILFESLPTNLPPATIAAEAKRMLLSYLSSAAPRARGRN